MDWLPWPAGPTQSLAIAFTMSLFCSLAPSSTSIPSASHGSRHCRLSYSRGLNTSIFLAPPAAYIDKICLSLALPTISCLIRMSKKHSVQSSDLPFFSEDSLYYIMFTIDVFFYHESIKHLCGRQLTQHNQHWYYRVSNYQVLTA